MTKYGYARVSTPSQNLSDQIEQLVKAGVKPVNIFKEKFTGTTDKRPEFLKLKEQLIGGDELVVAKLDRLGRKTRNVISFLDKCSRENITVNILNLGILDNSASGRLMRNVISSFAEFERDMIVARTTEGKEYAKAHNPNYREGRLPRRITPHYQAAYDYLCAGHSYKDTAQAFGLSKSTLYRIKKQINNEK